MMKNLMKSTAVAATTLMLCLTPAGAHQAPSHEMSSGNAGIVDTVVDGSPAAAAGLRAGDRLVRLDDQPIATLNDLQRVMGMHEPGDTVPMRVERDGEALDLSLTFGNSSDGSVSIGIRINLMTAPASGAEAGEGTTQCLDWLETTYRIEMMLSDLELGLSEEYETMLACVARDTGMMPPANAVKFCDNVFKVHCSGIDLLTEIGEALVERCAEQVAGSLGIRPQQYRSWKTCAEEKVYERYSMTGQTSDAKSCRAALLDECGKNIDAAAQAGDLSPEQREFAGCCAADDLGSSGQGRAGRCAMIDDGFTRGPCRDRPVCIDRMTGEWLHCPVPE